MSTPPDRHLLCMLLQVQGWLKTVQGHRRVNAACVVLQLCNLLFTSWREWGFDFASALMGAVMVMVLLSVLWSVQMIESANNRIGQLKPLERSITLLLLSQNEAQLEAAMEQMDASMSRLK